MLRGPGGLPEAIRVAETALDLAQASVPGRRHSSIALSLEKLGQLHDQAGDHAAARPYLVKAHRGAAAERSRPIIARSIVRRGGSAFSSIISARPRRRSRIYEEAIDAGTQLPDLPYSDLGTMLNNIALMYRKSGRQKAAEPYYLHALEIYEKQLGPEHADVASVLNNLAVFYTNERRFAEAEKTHLRALAIREKMHPADASGHRAIEVQSRGRLSFARRLPARLGALPRLAASVGGSDRRSRRPITRSSPRTTPICCAR